MFGCLSTRAGAYDRQELDTLIYDYEKQTVRIPTGKEYMRVQGVPDYITDKLIASGISDTQLYRAAGDACTTNVIYEIAKRL